MGSACRLPDRMVLSFLLCYHLYAWPLISPTACDQDCLIYVVFVGMANSLPNITHQHLHTSLMFMGLTCSLPDIMVLSFLLCLSFVCMAWNQPYSMQPRLT
jgi:hypothetical protein